MRRTNRILPVYSADISGICSALYELGGMTVMHDASGCNSTYTTHDEPRWYSMDSMVYISALSELDAVMGDDGKMVRDIVDAARNLHPRFICMGGTPIPMMMGTDFKGIARIIERETGIPTFGISSNGMHSYVQGAGEALRQIAIRFCHPREELHPHGVKLGVNLLGVTPLDFSLTGNAARMKNFLTSHGMNPISCWAMDSSLEEMSMAGLADVNLIVSAAGLPVAMELERMYGTPYVIGTPVGRKTALRLAGLLRLSSQTGKNHSLFGGEAGAEGVSGPWNADLGITGLPEDLSGEHILIVGEQIVSGSIRCSLREDFGARDVRVLCPTEGDERLAEPGDILVWDEDKAIDCIGKSTVVIADPLYRQVCPENGKLVFVDFPHEAFSGRMYHDSMKPFVCKTGDVPHH